MGWRKKSLNSPYGGFTVFCSYKHEFNGKLVCVSMFVSVSLTHTLIQLLTHNNVHQHVLAIMPHMLFFMLSILVCLVDALL